MFTAFLQERTAGGLGGAAGFVWNGQNRQFDLLSGDGFQTWDRLGEGAFWQGLSSYFIRVSDEPLLFLSSHEDVPSLFCGKHKSNRLLENNNLVFKKKTKNPTVHKGNRSFYRRVHAKTRLFFLPTTKILRWKFPCALEHMPKLML